MALERLQKILARAGVASRRASEELIADGRVTVDGQVVTAPGTKADPQTQDVRVDGRRLRAERPEYWILNKPKGVVCTNFDPAGRPRAVDLMGGSKARLFPVGRLDADSKGLLLLTNDGEFANLLAHPSHGVPKTYLATVSGRATPADVYKLLKGVYLAEGKARAAHVRILKKGAARSLLEITLREGRNRQIRRVLASLRHPVRELVRTRVGRISLRGLGVGRSRPLDHEEIEYLKKLAAASPFERPAFKGKHPGNAAGPTPERPRPPKPARDRGGPSDRQRRRTRRPGDQTGPKKNWSLREHDAT